MEQNNGRDKTRMRKSKTRLQDLRRYSFTNYARENVSFEGEYLFKFCTFSCKSFFLIPQINNE